MDVSILLTTYNREEDCIKCLTKLLEQKTDKIEILLLDDLHYESEKLRIFCLWNSIRYIHTGIQKNRKPLWRVPGFALNIGAKLSVGEYLIIGNAEIYQVSDNTVELMKNTGIVSYPRVWDQPEDEEDLSKYKKFDKLKRLPFFYGVPRKAFFEIRGYDEDFVGYAWEDHDLITRLDKVVGHTEINADVVHLWNSRGMLNRDYAPNLGENSLKLNRKIFYAKERGNAIRNIDREWGKL